MYDFYRLACASPVLRVADIPYNVSEIIRCARLAEAEGADLVLFPELSVTGATCGDLFHQPYFLQEAWNGVQRIAAEFKDSAMILIAGVPVLHKNNVYNCAAVIQKNNITLTPAGKADRHFADGTALIVNETETAFASVFAVEDEPNFTFGIEIGDEWKSISAPGLEMIEQGVSVICNPSKGNFIAKQAELKRQTFRNRSELGHVVYLSAASGVQESTTDFVCDGQLLIAEDGILKEHGRYSANSEILYADVDLTALQYQKLKNKPDLSATLYNDQYVMLQHPGKKNNDLKYREIDSHPFLCKNDGECEDIFRIQTAGLAKRLEVTGSVKAVLGLSGGLDSTLAMLVCAETFTMLGRDMHDILTLTLPGFGTTKRTKGNAEKMAEALGAELRTVDIKAACLQHFQDIGHDPADHTVTYENTQARERTQILMDVANRERGLLIGTGDLSEIALGWCTYNADHMSMYSVNPGIPKTLVRQLVEWYANTKAKDELKAILLDVLATPVSPELLPGDADGGIQQKTESILGAYELHDFYLYQFIKYGASPEKILKLALKTFGTAYPEEEIRRTLQLFFRRFFTQQFKRSCMPDGPQTTEISLSPRTSWQMPSDAVASVWLNKLEK
ncbi:MAG: NAD(+) synthase [Lentisphaeria bacterium]|nr:NAD(+) synthase [Lentisphaeria bacterium]